MARVNDFRYRYKKLWRHTKRFYYRVDNMNFGEAIESIKRVKKVARRQWNNTWLMYVQSSSIPYRSIGTIVTKPWIGLGVSGGTFVPYIPSMQDILETDWILKE